MRILSVAVILTVAAGALAAQELTVRWDSFAAGLASPVQVTHAGDGSGRLIVVEQRGTVQVLTGGVTGAEPLLDITERVRFSGEMGLLGIAFPPRYPEKRYFYVNYVNRNQETIVSRFRLREASELADPASEEVLLRIPQPFTNHNGGQLQFGPKDGYLYIGMGDGGSSFDPGGNAQNRDSLLGKILRIDTESGAAPYAIPDGNPFKGGGGRPEIWSYGWRNPWRFSFDRVTGDLWVGDVGQRDWEEIDFEPAGTPGGRNYGWAVAEGFHCVTDSSCQSRGDLTPPVFEYGHDDGCSVTGGVVYRGGQYPELQGRYFFGDYCSGLVWSLRGGTRQYGASGMQISSFGEDEDGEIYATDYNGGVRRLVLTTGGFSIRAIGSGASYEIGMVGGGIASAFTTPLPGVEGVLAASVFPLPTTMSGVTVEVNGVPAPLYAVSPEQINFVAPWGLTGSAARVVVTAGGRSSANFAVPVDPATPGLFLRDATMVAVVGESGVTEGVRRGEIIALYATGLGPVENPPPDGAAAGASLVLAPVEVTIDGRRAEVSYAGLAPGFAGLYQINCRVPEEASAGVVDIWVTTQGRQSPSAKLLVRQP